MIMEIQVSRLHHGQAALLVVGVAPAAIPHGQNDSAPRLFLREPDPSASLTADGRACITSSTIRENDDSKLQKPPPAGKRREWQRIGLWGEKYVDDVM